MRGRSSLYVAWRYIPGRIIFAFDTCTGACFYQFSIRTIGISYMHLKRSLLIWRRDISPNSDVWSHQQGLFWFTLRPTVVLTKCIEDGSPNHNEIQRLLVVLRQDTLGLALSQDKTFFQKFETSCRLLWSLALSRTLVFMNNPRWFSLEMIDLLDEVPFVIQKQVLSFVFFHASGTDLRFWYFQWFLFSSHSRVH